MVVTDVLNPSQADPDLIILGHLKIYSPTPGSNTCPMSSLHATKTCPRLLQTDSFFLFVQFLFFFVFFFYFFTLKSTCPTPVQEVLLLSPCCTKTLLISCLRRESFSEAGGSFMTFPSLAKSEKP